MKEKKEREQKAIEDKRVDDKVELKVAERLRKAKALMNPDVIINFYLDEMKEGENKKKVNELIEKNPSIKLLASSIINQQQKERKEFETVSNNILSK